MEADGIIVRDGQKITVTEPGRPFLRSVCAVFDRYLPPVQRERRHAIADQPFRHILAFSLKKRLYTDEFFPAPPTTFLISQAQPIA